MKSLVKSLITPFLAEVDIPISTKTIGVFGGGFQPPTKGHFEVVKQALSYPNLDEFNIYVGTGGGRSDITQDQSVAIWNIYKNYLPSIVNIIPSSNPITSIYSLAKDEPNAQIKWFLGSREGKEADFADFEKRTKSALGKTNIEPINIITSDGISGTAARAVLDNKEEFFNYLPDIDEADKEEIYNILNPSVEEGEEITNFLEEKIEGDSIVCDNCGWTWKIKDGGNDLFICHKCGHDNTPKKENTNFFEPLQNQDIDIKISSEPTRVDYYKDHIKNVVPSDFKVEKQKDKIVVSNISKPGLEHNPEFKDKLVSLTMFMIDNGLNIEPLPNLIFIEDDKQNASNILGRTAHYDPDNKCITLYTYNRHPKDILRSYAHEMIHHIQNLEGRISNITTQNINEDEYLKELELEAYSKGNMCFRGWENSIKPSVNEWVIGIPKFSQPKTFIDNLRESLHEIVLSKDNAVEINGSLTDGQFTVGDQTYVYKIKEFPTPPYYDPGLFYNIEFHPEGNPNSEPQGGKENYVKILSTMYKVILDFVEQEKPEYIGIASLDNEGSKNYHTVYANLTDNKFNRIPGYFRKDVSLRFDGPRGKGKMVVLKRKND